MQVPASAERVRTSTPESINDRIVRQTRERIEYYSAHPEKIDDRLEELDREWDTERVLETNAGSLMVAGTLLGAAVSKRWLLLSAAVGGFLVQHGVQGWCPPLPVLRRLGVRTPREIEAERYALMSIRGDFEKLEGDDAERAEAAADATGRLEPMDQVMEYGSSRV